MRISIFSQFTNDVKSQCLDHIKPIVTPLAGKMQHVKGTSWVVQNWRITDPRWGTAAKLEIHKQVYL